MQIFHTNCERNPFSLNFILALYLYIQNVEQFWEKKNYTDQQGWEEYGLIISVTCTCNIKVRLL